MLFLIIICMLLALSIKGLSAKDTIQYYVLEYSESYDSSYLLDQLPKYIIARDNKADLRKVTYSTGIPVINDSFERETLYPVYFENHVIGCIIIYTNREDNSSCYSTDMNSRLEKYLLSTTKENPAILVQIEDEMCVVSDDKAYAIYSDNVFDFDRTLINSYEVREASISALNDTYDPDVYQIKHNWTRYAYQSNKYAFQCVSYSLYNIFRNKGMYSLSYSSFHNEITPYTLYNSGYHMDYSNIDSYLSTKNYTTYYRSTTSKLSWTNIKTVVNVRNNYVLMINSISGATGKHVTVLTGYIIWSDGTYDFYVYDPFNANELVVDGDATSIIFTSAGQTNTWNAGYYAGIH